jgi:hypothetical protein
MAHAHVAAQQTSQLEYTVYIYHRPENQIEGQSDWEMRSVSRDRKSAMIEARRLYKTQNFKKVEIKQRVKNPRTTFDFDQTLKVLEQGRNRKKVMASLWIFGVLSVSLASVAAIVAFS